MLNLSDDQLTAFQAAMRKRVEEEAKNSVLELDRTLDVVVSKLVNEGWTLPAELPIAAVNALGKTTELNSVYTSDMV